MYMLSYIWWCVVTNYIRNNHETFPKLTLVKFRFII